MRKIILFMLLCFVNVVWAQLYTLEGFVPALRHSQHYIIEINQNESIGRLKEKLAEAIGQREGISIKMTDIIVTLHGQSVGDGFWVGDVFKADEEICFSLKSSVFSERQRKIAQATSRFKGLLQKLAPSASKPTKLRLFKKTMPQFIALFENHNDYQEIEGWLNTHSKGKLANLFTDGWNPESSGIKALACYKQGMLESDVDILDTMQSLDSLKGFLRMLIANLLVNRADGVYSNKQQPILITNTNNPNHSVVNILPGSGHAEVIENNPVAKVATEIKELFKLIEKADTLEKELSQLLSKGQATLPDSDKNEVIRIKKEIDILNAEKKSLFTAAITGFVSLFPISKPEGNEINDLLELLKTHFLQPIPTLNNLLVDAWNSKNSQINVLSYYKEKLLADNDDILAVMGSVRDLTGYLEKLIANMLLNGADAVID